MKSKYLLFLFLPFAAVFFQPSCAPHWHSPVIGLLMDEFKVERWAKDTTLFIERVKELNGKVICMVANGDPAKQAEQARKLIDEGVDVLVILPVDLNKAAEIVKRAKQASIPTISYDRLIQKAPLDYYISFDNVKVGELQAGYIKERLGVGTIALLGGPATDQNSFFLHYGQMGYLQPYIERGEIKIVFDKNVKEWSFDEGYRLARECLRTNKVDAIIAGNDLLARGAIKALEEKGLAGIVLVAGQDADTQACENIIRGVQTVTIYKSIHDLAGNAAKLAIDLANQMPVTNATFTTNNGMMNVPSVLLVPTLVNKGNIGLQIRERP